MLDASGSSKSSITTTTSSSSSSSGSTRKRATSYAAGVMPASVRKEGSGGDGGVGQDTSSSMASSSSSSFSSGIFTRRRAKTSADQYRIVGNHFQLGAEIGKGGFGTVYAALDIQNGRSVAIKQISLREIDQEELVGIESEISLLKKLNHENIVKYHDTIKTDDHLYIVLEYMENGSLAQLIKKFGTLSETLVAMYISQVLRGLYYLHEQGVLHRDIKGANILTTKDGLVKLADFGVAIRMNESQKSFSVVGTPYWMAPEVIEMAGCSSASDIWSVGCTIVELLTGKPPYFDLAPMAALFRIVQDDHPPLPEGISPALHDFIMKCFMKEPRLRLSAQDLLLHPWISSIPKNKVEQSTQLVASSAASNNDRDVILNTIKMYSIKKVDDLEDLSKSIELNAKMEEETNEDWDIGLDINTNEKVVGHRSKLKASDDEAYQEDVDEDWDHEFGWESRPSSMSLLGDHQAELEKQRLADAEIVEAQMRALKGTHVTKPSPFNPPVMPQFQLSKDDAKHLLEDFFWDDEQEVQDVTSTLKRQIIEAANATATAPAAMDTGNVSTWRKLPASMLIKGSNLQKLNKFKEKDDDELEQDEFADDDLWTNDLNSTRTRSFDFDLASRLKRQLMEHATQSSQQEAIFGTSFQDNVFDEFEFDNVDGKDVNVKLSSHTLEKLSLLHPSMDDTTILNACQELHQIFSENPNQKALLMSHPGVIPNIMDSLQIKKIDVLCAVLKIVNLIIEDNKKWQENMALVGLVPIIVKINHTFHSVSTSHEREMEAFCHEMEIHREKAKFVCQSCKTSTLTLQMFIACGGLPVLVDLLELDAAQTLHDCIHIAIDGILAVFTLQTIPRNDFCRLFVKVGLLRKLIRIFHHYVEDFVACHSQGKESVHIEDLRKTSDIFLLFSQGDVIVKEHMSEQAVLQGILHSLNPNDLSCLKHPTYSALVVRLLKSIRNLSMEPNTLDRLDQAGTIFTLTHLLNQEHDTNAAKDIQNIVLHTMFYLCRINKNRQTQAAQAGLIPFLHQVTMNRSPLRQFALPILCDLAHASSAARFHLWATHSVAIFLDLLSDKYWQGEAIHALAVWLSHDTFKVEAILLQPEHLLQLINVVRSSQQVEFENILEPLIEILSKSVSINQALGRSGLFVTEMINRLLYPRALVRKQILKIIKLLFEAHHQPRQFVMQYNFYATIQTLAQDKNMVLVVEMANQLMDIIYRDSLV